MVNFDIIKKYVINDIDDIFGIVKMRIFITPVALESYLDLKHARFFTSEEYETILRPDALRLKNFNTDPKFLLQQFWCPVKIR